jgi:hypothetical protein
MTLKINVKIGIRKKRPCLGRQSDRAGIPALPLTLTWAVHLGQVIFPFLTGMATGRNELFKGLT